MDMGNRRLDSRYSRIACPPHPGNIYSHPTALFHPANGIGKIPLIPLYESGRLEKGVVSRFRGNDKGECLDSTRRSDYNS